MTWLDILCARDPIPNCPGAGSFTGGAPKLLWHTTEGGTYAGARATYQQTHSIPQITADIVQLRAYQHLPLNVAATALKHPTGNGETNKDNVTQVEIVGFSAQSPNWSAVQYAFLARLARGIEAARGVHRSAGVRFVAAGYGANNRVRLDWPTWHLYSGHLGHQHAPYNDHGDPGAIRIDLILDELGDDDVTDTDKADIVNKVVAALTPVIDAKVNAAADNINKHFSRIPGYLPPQP